MVCVAGMQQNLSFLKQKLKNTYLVIKSRLIVFYRQETINNTQIAIAIFFCLERAMPFQPSQCWGDYFQLR